MKQEKRYISEIRSVGEGENSRHIVGYALLFDSQSVQLGDFKEVIKPEALNDEILKRSDVLALLDHNISRGVLARSKYGEGSLTLTIDDKGLRYEFDAPNTALGDELIEGIKRGDIANSSFSFLVKRDEWQQTPDGGYLRTILEFDKLFDVSPVYSPAYDETSVEIGLRGLEQFKKEIENRMKDEETKPAEDEVKDEENKPAETEPQNEEKPAEGENKSDEPDENECRADEPEEKEPEPADAPADEEKEEKEDEPKQDEKRNTNIAMTKNFSLLKAIRSVVNGEQFDAYTAKVIAEGRSIMSAANQAVNGQIVLPVEKRAEGDVTTPAATANGIMATVEGAGIENVAEDKLDIVEPLRNRSALGLAGATFLTGLVGDLSIPVYSGSNCAWKGETVTADNGEGEFSEVNLKPKRLTAFIDISKQFIYQDSNSAEEMLRRDLVNAISEKLEMTIFGSDAGTATKPAGLFNGVTADSAAVKFGDIVDWEAELEDNNINGEIKYIVNPSAKAILRKTAKDTGSGLFVMADGEIEGNEVISTASVVKKGVILGDFTHLVVGQWGALDVVVDPYTKAADGMIRVVVNAYFDAALRRPNAVVKHILK